MTTYEQIYFDTVDFLIHYNYGKAKILGSKRFIFLVKICRFLIWSKKHKFNKVKEYFIQTKPYIDL
jgi:hypothetical protein